MSANEKRDVLIHFDEDGEEIIFYTVDSASTETIRKSEFDGARTEIEWFQDKIPDEAEKDLGSMIFSLIDAFSAKKVMIRDYKALSDTAHQEYIADLERESENNSAEAKYYLFIDFHARALKECDLGCLNKAESLLRLSADLGYQEAEARLNSDWELMKGAVLRRIKRSNKS
ncbi:hypothetical protein L0668_09230 [Paraglaciecola aquimarina]|uniref:DUF4376 domain-containing protein n=1 Tax=Paraglaciecola algarum TaxID=3050085 RepID=A0ABS9D5T2_9ALTE|nr:hypothetical protein [Paraglaciecola sp. G1-23]MCF2948286.1 hypothetical protein [Paraglaciecola sp. G1-23]